MTKFNELTTPIDRVSKLLFKEYADVLLKLAFPDQAVQLVGVAGAAAFSGSDLSGSASGQGNDPQIVLKGGEYDSHKYIYR